jgi:hypothetical protein
MPLQLFADFCAKIEPDRRNSTVEKIICNNRHRAEIANLVKSGAT